LPLELAPAVPVVEPLTLPGFPLFASSTGAPSVPGDCGLPGAPVALPVPVPAPVLLVEVPALVPPVCANALPAASAPAARIVAA
jgi:hypothetical protein